LDIGLPSTAVSEEYKRQLGHRIYTRDEFLERLKLERGGAPGSRVMLESDELLAEGSCWVETLRPKGVSVASFASLSMDSLEQMRL